MFLTRIGFGARAVVTGDPTQIDLPKHVKSGLMDAADILAGVRGLAFTHFQSEDVVRHPLVGRIVDAYAARRAETEKRGTEFSLAVQFASEAGELPSRAQVPPLGCRCAGTPRRNHRAHRRCREAQCSTRTTATRAMCPTC